MSETYMPMPGDKVRATLGDSVVVGEVDEVEHSRVMTGTVWVCPQPENFDRVELRLGGSLGWRFERVVAVPSKRLAVIRRADGTIFMLHSTGAKYPWSGVDDWVSRSVDEATLGGFTVLFDGVDE